RATMRASLRNRASISSSRPSWLARSLMATRWSSSRWVASTTRPIPPSPRRRSTRYLPSRVVPGAGADVFMVGGSPARGRPPPWLSRCSILRANTVLAVEVGPAVVFVAAGLALRALLAPAAAVDGRLVAVLHAVVAALAPRGDAARLLARTVFVGDATDAG